MKKFLMFFGLLSCIAISKLQAQTHTYDSGHTPGMSYTTLIGGYGDKNVWTDNHEIYRALAESNEVLPSGISVSEVSVSVFFDDGFYSKDFSFDNTSGDGVADVDFDWDYPGSTGYWTTVEFFYYIRYSDGNEEWISDTLHF